MEYSWNCEGSSCFDEDAYHRWKLVTNNVEDTVPKQSKSANYDERMANYLKSLEENVSILDFLYWKLLLNDVLASIANCTIWLRRTLGLFGWEMAACVTTGTVFLFIVGLFLKFFGPMRLKTLGLVIIMLIFGSIIATESIEIVTSSLVGIVVLLLLTRTSLRFHVSRQTFTIANVDPVVICVHFWYLQDRAVSFNLSQGLIISGCAEKLK